MKRLDAPDVGAFDDGAKLQQWRREQARGISQTSWADGKALNEVQQATTRYLPLRAGGLYLEETLAQSAILMNLATAYLSKPSTQRILGRKPGQEGFSLIELVVVIAVLAVLTAIALPNFLGVSDDASARSAQQAAITAFKECQVFKARGQANLATSKEFEDPKLADFNLTSVAVAATPVTVLTFAKPTAPVDDCFTVTTVSGSSTGALNSVAIYPKTDTKFPTFFINGSGVKTCKVGSSTAYPDTYDIGCSQPDTTKAGEWT